MAEHGVDDRVVEALIEAQQLGFLGPRPIEEAVEHSMAFVRALPPTTTTRIVDIGSGGGLPGLVIGACAPDCTVLLVDRRQKRADFLRRAVARLGWSHVSVSAADANDLAREVSVGKVEPFDVVTARGFGPPLTTLSLAVQLVHASGAVVVSEPPGGDRWPTQVLDSLGVVADRRGAVSVFHRA